MEVWYLNNIPGSAWISNALGSHKAPGVFFPKTWRNHRSSSHGYYMLLYWLIMVNILLMMMVIIYIYIIWLMMVNNNLLGGWAYPSEKNIWVKVSWDDDIPTIWKNKINVSKPPTSYNIPQNTSPILPMVLIVSYSCLSGFWWTNQVTVVEPTKWPFTTGRTTCQAQQFGAFLQGCTIQYPICYGHQMIDWLKSTEIKSVKIN